MPSSEKPAIRGSAPPSVSLEDSAASSLSTHRDDIFFAAIETTRMPMLVTDPRQEDNPIIFANRAFLSMTGYSAKEVIGHNCRFLQGPDTDPAAVAALREAIAERREITTEILNYRKDGSSFWNALYVSPVYNANQEVVFFFASQLDVSRRRDAEEALSQSQKMEALGQLTGGISHDFNNLLQVVSGHLDILRLKLGRDPVDSESARRSVESARAAVNKAATLTQQLLAFSRKQRLEGRPINLNATAESITDLARQTLGNGVEVTTELEPTLSNCHIDPTQLEVALLNILINARDAMPEGGNVTVKTHNVRVSEEDVNTFAGLTPGTYVAISITDTGTGIPPEFLPRVMDPFFTTKDEGKGTGLGLSMVYGFAKQSGGTVDIYSEVGTGTTVRLYFPTTQAQPRVPAQTSKRASRGGDETILVVDDRAEVAGVARDMLESLGYTVHVADSGADALRLLDEMEESDGTPRPDLLFTDLIMPGGMNGFALAREVRRRVPDVRVLVTTGFAGDNATRNADAGSEFEMLKKPYRLDELARKVRVVLDGVTGSRQ